MTIGSVMRSGCRRLDARIAAGSVCPLAAAAQPRIKKKESPCLRYRIKGAMVPDSAIHLPIAFVVSLPKACAVIRFIGVTRSVRRRVAGIAVAIFPARDRVVPLALGRVGPAALASGLEAAREGRLFIFLRNDAPRQAPAGSVAVGTPASLRIERRLDCQYRQRYANRSRDE